MCESPSISVKPIVRIRRGEGDTMRPTVTSEPENFLAHMAVTRHRER